MLEICKKLDEINEVSKAVLCASEIANYVNSFNRLNLLSKEEMAKNPAVKSAIIYFMGWVYELRDCYKFHMYDLRNEKACETAVKLIEAVGEEAIIDFRQSVTYCRTFIMSMSREHRTLQQKFSIVCFYTLYMYLTNFRGVGSGNFDKKVFEDAGLYVGEGTDGFWQMPLI